MKAIAIQPGVAGSIHLRDVPRPNLEDVPDGRGVRVRIIRAGLCGTDADLAAGDYGRAPEGADHLILGHETLGRVVEVGPGAAGETAPGQLVVITIRRPGSSAHDRIGRPDLSTNEVFIEAGISRAHGFMTEEVVVESRYLVPVPDELEGVAILAEPLSCITKSLRQADQIQARLGLWEPRRALVTGAGTIGLLATLALRQRGLDVTTYARRPAPNRNSQLVEHLGARYAAADADADLADVASRCGPFDIVFEGSGAPQLIEPAIAALAPNGVLALFSVTPGSRPLTVDMARLNQAVVLYNRVIVGSAAAAWDDYAAAVATIARAQAEATTRGWLAELITDRIDGFDVEAIARHLSDGRDVIKAVVELAGAASPAAA